MRISKIRVFWQNDQICPELWPNMPRLQQIQILGMAKPPIAIFTPKGCLQKKNTPYGGTLSQLEGGGGNKLQNVPT